MNVEDQGRRTVVWRGEVCRVKKSEGSGDKVDHNRVDESVLIKAGDEAGAGALS